MVGGRYERRIKGRMKGEEKGKELGGEKTLNLFDSKLIYKLARVMSNFHA